MTKNNKCLCCGDKNCECDCNIEEDNKGAQKEIMNNNNCLYCEEKNKCGCKLCLDNNNMCVCKTGDIDNSNVLKSFASLLSSVLDDEERLELFSRFCGYCGKYKY